MPEIAPVVTVDLHRHKLIVDGVEFPWLIVRDSLRFTERDDAPGLHEVHLSFFTDKVEAIDSGHAAFPEPISMSADELNNALEWEEADRVWSTARWRADCASAALVQAAGRKAEIEALSLELRAARAEPWVSPVKDDAEGAEFVATVDEVSASVRAAGDVLGAAINSPGLGGVIDSALSGIYEEVLGAYKDNAK